MKLPLMALSASILLISGCGKYEGVSPTNNIALNAISPSNATNENGYMQKALDGWLKESWDPIMADQPTQNTKTSDDGTKVTTKTEPTTKEVELKGQNGEMIKKTVPATLITTTVVKPSGETKTVTETVLVENNEPFTLQKYVDRWDEYLKRKKALGIESAPSHYEKMNSMPVIGK